MKALAAVSLMLVLAGSVPLAAAQQPCRIERVTFRVQGLQMVSWIMRPARDGRFPVVVWNHGSKETRILAPIIDENTPCHPLVTSSGFMIFFPQPRGYGGSEGPNPITTLLQDPIPYLRGRADDVNASVEWLTTRADVVPACIVNMGFSMGGYTAFLASASKPQLYRATIAQAPGYAIAFDGQNLGTGDMIRAGKNISSPILIQSNTEDAVIFVEATRVIVRELRRLGKAVDYKEYTHPSGHPLFNLPMRPELFSIWGPDAARFLEPVFRGCVR